MTWRIETETKAGANMEVQGSYNKLQVCPEFSLLEIRIIVEISLNRDLDPRVLWVNSGGEWRNMRAGTW